MKREDIFSKLFEFSIPTFYNWQREKRPIIKLLDKYFSKEELEDFLEYGAIEKLEFLKFQDYLQNESDFIFILSALNNLGNTTPTNYIDYLAYALSYDCGAYVSFLNSKKEFLEIFTCSYDNYPGYFTSDNLGMAINQIYAHFPKREGYADIIAYFMNSDFLPFIKSCIQTQPQYINLAIQLCIHFNLYKYKSTYLYEDLYQKFQMPFDTNVDFSSALQIVTQQFNYEAFKNEMKAIKQEIL